MVIYSENIKKFELDCLDPNILVSKIEYNLKNKFGIRVGETEKRSWINSRPSVSNLINIVANDKRIVLIEFNAPTTKKRIDFIILGKNKNQKPSAWILELKQWSEIKEEEWNKFRAGKYYDSHPSAQAQDYQFRLEYEMGLEKKVNIKSGAYLHNLKTKNTPLLNSSYNRYLSNSELFSALDAIRLSNLIEYHTKIKDGREAFDFFKEANWNPSKKFSEIIAEEFKSLVLVGTQKIIYEKIEKFIKNYKKSKKWLLLYLEIQVAEKLL